MQRKEAARNARAGAIPRTPSYPVYTPPTRPTVPDTYDSYEAEKNKTNLKPMAIRGKGMQLGKKSKTTNMFEKVRGELGPEAEESAPLVVPPPAAPAAVEKAAPARVSLSGDREAVHVTVAETVTVKLTREGSLKSFEVKGDLQLRISDQAFTKVKLDLIANATLNAQFRTHPNVDKAVFTNQKIIQLKDTSKRFPANNSIGVLRWRATAASDTPDIAPITFTVWVNKGSDGSVTITVEYELSTPTPLKNVAVTIPYSGAEPSISSFDANYSVSGDSLEWVIGDVDEDNSNGAFEFEAPVEDESEFFPMAVTFSKESPFVEVDVKSVSLIDEGEEVNFSKDVRCTADDYLVE